MRFKLLRSELLTAPQIRPQHTVDESVASLCCFLGQAYGLIDRSMIGNTVQAVNCKYAHPEQNERSGLDAANALLREAVDNVIDPDAVPDHPFDKRANEALPRSVVVRNSFVDRNI